MRLDLVAKRIVGHERGCSTIYGSIVSMKHHPSISEGRPRFQRSMTLVQRHLIRIAIEHVPGGAVGCTTDMVAMIDVLG